MTPAIARSSQRMFITYSFPMAKNCCEHTSLCFCSLECHLCSLEKTVSTDWMELLAPLPWEKRMQQTTWLLPANYRFPVREAANRTSVSLCSTTDTCDVSTVIRRNERQEASNVPFKQKPLRVTVSACRTVRHRLSLQRQQGKQRISEQFLSSPRTRDS